MQSEVKVDFTLEPRDDLPGFGMTFPSGRMRLDKVSYRYVGNNSVWIQLTYRRNWFARIYLTVRSWFVST